jgi:hypothetical protein
MCQKTGDFQKVKKKKNLKTTLDNNLKFNQIKCLKINESNSISTRIIAKIK